MAARGIALGRIIGWFHNADIEEALYVHQRASDIVKKRLDTVTRADAHHQAKKAKKSHHKQPQPSSRVPVVAEDIREAEIAAETERTERTEKDTKAASAS